MAPVAAVSDVADAINAMAAAFTDDGNSSHGMPQRREAAIEKIENDDGLSVGEQIKAMQVISRDIAIADSYLAIKNDDIHRGYLCA